MQLQDFFDYKNVMMRDLLTNEAIVKLLTNDEFLLAHPEQLAYKQVFPYEFIPDTVDDGKTFICFDVDIQRSINKTFLEPVIYIWVFSHKSLLRLPEGGVRVDKIVAEIAKAINGSREYGLGELDLYSSRRFAPIDDYLGKQLTFNAVEFNRPKGSTSKFVPANRKENVCQ